MTRFSPPILLILTTTLVLPGCGLPEPTAEVDEGALRSHVNYLASDALEGRNGGYEGERQAARYIADQLRQLELEPAGEAGTFLQHFEFHPRLQERPGQTLTSQNVVAVLRGTRDSENVEPIIVGAHLDGQGRAGQADPGRKSGDPAAPEDQIWNAANDNAVSVAVLLEVARLFKAGAYTNDRDLIFCLFGAEEHGIVGAFEYVNSPVAPVGETAAMLNLEQLGRRPGEDLMAVGFATSGMWPEVLARADARTGRKTLLALDLPAADTDHYPFFVLGIPAMTLGHPDDPMTHTPADEPQSLSFEDLVWRTELVAAVIEELATVETRPKFTADISRELPLAAVATSPEEIAAAGLAPDTRALRVVVALNPWAAPGRLEVGDLITGIDGLPLPPEAEYELHRLARERSTPGCLQMTVLRAGEMLELCP